MTKVSYLGIIISLVTFASLFLPWWSIRASGVSMDIYPFRVMAWTFPTYDADWVVDRLLTLDSSLLIVGLLVVISTIISAVGSVKFPPLLIAPVVLNLTAGFLFYKLMYSAIGKLAFGSFSGTNLTAIPGEPWGFAMGIGLCVLAGVASLAPLVLSLITTLNQREARKWQNYPKTHINPS